MSEQYHVGKDHTDSDPTHLHTEGDVNWGIERRRWHEGLTHGPTRDALSKDAAHFVHQALSTPCLDVLHHADGIRLYTLDGRSYIDFHGNNVHQLGYRNAFILDRLKQQLDELAFSPRRFTNLPAISLAAKLSSLTRHQLPRVLFAPGGTSAIGMAVKLARMCTGKFKTLAMYDAFHGASLDSISVGGERVFQQGLGPLMAGNLHVPPVDTYRGKWFVQGSDAGDMAYADYIEYIFEKESDIGALVAETVRSTTVHVPSRAYWQRIRWLCDKYDVLLVLDEIPIGMGRTGTMFAYEHFGIVPDILVLGKGLGAGIVPMAAMLCREELNVAAHVSLGHYTHEKSPLGATAACAVIDYMELNHTLQHVASLGDFLLGQLSLMQDTFEVIGDVRGIGLLCAIELVRDRASKTPNNELAEKVLYRCLSQGLNFKVSDGNVLSFYPPLIITQDELTEALAILEEAFRYCLEATDPAAGPSF